MSEVFQLPLGLIQGNAVVRDVVLKPMTAGTRRSLSSRKSQKNPAAGMTSLLGSCCEQIGGIPPTPQLIDSLTTGDRDFMLLSLRRISIGPILKAQMTCPRCQEEISFDLSTDDIKIKTCELGQDYRIEGSFPVTDLKNENLGLDVVIRFPVGYDQSVISNINKVDPLEATYQLYARLIKSWSKNGNPVENPNTLSFIDSIPLNEIEWLESELRSKLPGPDWMVTLTCELCSKKTLLDLSDTDFLFKTPL